MPVFTPDSLEINSEKLEAMPSFGWFSPAFLSVCVCVFVSVPGQLRIRCSLLITQTAANSAEAEAIRQKEK